MILPGSPSLCLPLRCFGSVTNKPTLVPNQLLTIMCHTCLNMLIYREMSEGDGEFQRAAFSRARTALPQASRESTKPKHFSNFLLQK